MKNSTRDEWKVIILKYKGIWELIYKILVDRRVILLENFILEENSTKPSTFDAFADKNYAKGDSKALIELSNEYWRIPSGEELEVLSKYLGK